MRLDMNKVYFLDESGFQYSMRRGYGKSKIGSPAYNIVPAIRTKNIYAIYATISNNGVFFFEIMDRAYNIEHFSEFIDQLMEKFDGNRLTELTVVMDNVRFQHNTEIQQKIRAKGHSVLFLPPYSPFLNPIEKVFSKWKYLVKAGNRQTEDELYSLIHSANEKITGIAGLRRLLPSHALINREMPSER